MISILPLTFVTIVETGSITRAADKLNMAKSAVSQNLKRLEAQLGVKLANRTTRKFSPTPAGERYYLRCKEILVLSKLASTEIEEFGATPSGKITLTAPHAMISRLVAPAISKVLSQFPLLRPTIIADDQRLDLISMGIDLSVTVGSLADSNLKAKKIGVLRDILCVSSNLLAEPQSKNLNAKIAIAQALPYIAHIREQSIIKHQLIDSKSKKELSIEFKPTLYSNSIEALLAFVRQGLGVAMLPEFTIVDDLKSGRLIQLFPHYSMKETPIFATHAYDNMPPQSVVEVIRAIQKELLD